MESINFIFDHDFEQIKKYWLDLYDNLELNDNETIRIVPQIKKDEENIVFTSNEQINSYDKLVNYINYLDNKNGKGNVGYSISSAVFFFDPNNKDDKGNVVKPSTGTFEKIKNVVIDVDFYLAGTKDRFVLGYLEDTYIEFAALTVYLKIASLLKENGIKVIRPKVTGLTGSGLQFVLEIDRWINKEEATLFFNYLKKILGKVKQDVIVKDQLGNIAKVTAEVDTTFADIAHVQRVLGTINQKYSVLAKYLNIFDMNIFPEKINQIKNEFISFIDDNGFPLAQKNKYKALNLELDYPVFTDFYQTKKPELKPFLMVMDRFKNERYIYIADNPKKDFFAAKQLNWVTIRYKNPKGIYKDIANNAEYEVDSRSEILEKLKEII